MDEQSRMRAAFARRRLVLAAGAAGMLSLTTPLVCLARGSGKMLRVGTLSMGVVSEPNNLLFAAAMRELGYVEGKNIVFERRFAQGDQSKLEQMARELVQLGVDVIYVSSTAPTTAAMKATRSIPIVFVNVADPVGSGFVASLGHPGGNATGISVQATELSAKRVQLLRDTFPGIRRLAVFVTDESAASLQLSEVQRAAPQLKLQVLPVKFMPGASEQAAMSVVRQWRADALYFTETSQNFFNRQRLTQIAKQLRLPAVFGANYYAEAGGLMSYGSSYEANYRRAAIYVDKVLRGAHPSDLPVEQPTVFELVLNLKTARALHLEFPEATLLRADSTIE
ncbi:MAG: ABC transporter substrate-binding protein [Pseudomonadota bacterium]